MQLTIAFILFCYFCQHGSLKTVVINTWPFTNATDAAWNALIVNKMNAIDAVVVGCTECEKQQCDGTVGFGGSPDENGETTLDAMIMDGLSLDVGAVSCLRNIKQAIAVARGVLKYTTHSILSGELATEFAQSLNFPVTNLTTPSSKLKHKQWKGNKCQPNYRKNVVPNPKENCGPYHPSNVKFDSWNNFYTENTFKRGHDTIGMIAIDYDGNMASGTSTNGLSFKVPGRVSDSSIMGAGSYVDNDVGGAAATGDGDQMMRLLPSFLAVEKMRNGHTPTDACQFAIARIKKYYPNAHAGVISLNKNGVAGAACVGFSTFGYSIRNADDEKSNFIPIICH